LAWRISGEIAVCCDRQKQAQLFFQLPLLSRQGRGGQFGDPYACAKQTPERIANRWPNKDIDALMPWNFKPAE
jgi:transposase